MPPFEQMSTMGHEQVVFCRDETTGLKAIIAIHNTALGPSLGGCRFYDYANEEDALRDALRLSRGMTYKAAVAGLDLGGGKSVIIGDPEQKSEALFRAFGRQIQSLGGRYITAEDMNTNVHDMNNIRRETEWVTGVGVQYGGSGDPSPVTAWGVFNGIRACLRHRFGSDSVKGRTIAVQGLGNVGYHLAKHLHERGAKLIFSDINAERVQRAVKEFDGGVVEGDDYYSVECDVLAPCAIGGIINEKTISAVSAPIIAGGANNILDDEFRDSQLLQDAGILYAPDYVINAGGLISVAGEYFQFPRERAMAVAAQIFDTMSSIFVKSDELGITTLLASNEIAEERIDRVARVKRFHL